MKTKRFDFNFAPLRVSVSMVVDGSVPERQNYDAEAAEYTPDYTLTPLIIQPRISILDKDGVIASGEINAKLANVKWYEIVGGTKTQIGTSSTDYEMTTSGGQAGRIKVKKNAAVSSPITLEFYAEYADTRTGQLYIIQRTFLVKCDNSTEVQPRVQLDAADQTVYDPLTDTDRQTVHAKLYIGTSECAAANRQFVWEKYREDGTWSEIGTDTVLDYDVTVSADGTSCTVDRTLMGAELCLRCRAKYDADGNPSGVTLSATSPEKIVSFIRRIPRYEYDITDCPVNIPAGILTIAPEAKIWNTKGLISNPERELLFLWYAATNKASGILSYEMLEHGTAPKISTRKMDNTLGMVLALDVVDRGPFCAWEDSDGAVFEDADGNVIII